VRPILAGLDTEYGLVVEGRTPFDQIEDARDFVTCLHPFGFPGWDLRDEASRRDLRGYQVQALSVDPQDARYDQGATTAPDRADVVLPNGARLYNDHGHPEYATPECLSGNELALHDRAGDAWMRRAARIFAERTNRRVHVIKNNTDGEATWGAHESYLVPRSLGFEALYLALVPMLVTRTTLTGAGRVHRGQFQLSQRAEFFSERASVDTLYRRPIFNTRDEPHAAFGEWVRVHVITGDANMMPSVTARKVNLVKIALALAEIGQAPEWRLADPVRVFQDVSHSPETDVRIALEGGNWTTARFVLESYLEAAVAQLDPATPGAHELVACAQSSLELLEQKESQPGIFAQHVEWAAKRKVLTTFLASEGEDLSSPRASALDISWHDLDPEVGLYGAIHDAGWVAEDPAPGDVAIRMKHVTEPTRAFARSIAVRRWCQELSGVSWGRLVLGRGERRREALLPPDRLYPESLDEASDVDTFVSLLEQL